MLYFLFTRGVQPTKTTNKKQIVPTTTKNSGTRGEKLSKK